MNLKRSFPALALTLFLLVFAACQKEVSLEQGASAQFSLQDVFGDCLGDSVVGSYVAGQALNGDQSYVAVVINVRVPGRYSINSDVQNGFSFVGTGAFSDTGLVTLRIPARGTPNQSGITTFRFAQDSAVCEFSVNVTGAGQQGGGTCNAQVAGNYYKDTVLRASNKVTLSHNYTAAGTYTVSTDTINGFYFNKSVTVSAAGSQNIVLDGFGTPAATGVNNFTVRFGDGTTCGFPVTVSAGGTTPPPAATTYWPLTTGTWWSFSDPDSTVATDSLLVTVVGSSTIGGASYQFLQTKDATGAPTDTNYIRKDASGTFFQSLDLNETVTIAGVPFVTFPAGSRGDFPLLKETLTTGATWTSAAFQGTLSGVPVSARGSFTCVNANATVNVNGRVFTNVYQVSEVIEYSAAGAPYTTNPLLPVVTVWYAPNVGPIQIQVDSNAPQNGIRNWRIQ